MSIPDSLLSLRLGRLFGRQGLAWATLLVSALLFVGLWYFSSTDDARRSAERFALRAEIQRDLVVDRMRDHEQMLQGAAALFAASEEVSRQEWHDYVQALELDQRMPGVLGTGFSLMLRPGERAAHEAAVRAQGFPGYAIRPPGDRPLLSTILYLEPFTGDNLRAFGYDMFSEPVRQAAMQRAADSGRAALSGMVTLVQEGPGQGQPGFLIYVPIYRKGVPLASVDERRTALLGFAYSPFRAQVVLAKVFETSNLDVEIEVFDGPPASGRLLFASAQAAREARHMMVIDAVVAGQPWTLRVRSSQEFEAQTKNSAPTLILLGGLAFSLLLFALLSLQARHSRQMETAAGELERSRDELRAAASYSRSLLEASLDPLVTIDADGKISDVNAATETVTGRRRNELIGTDFWDYFTDPAQARAGYRHVFENGKVKDYPLTIRDAAGRLTEVLYNASVYRNERGEVAGIFAAARDVTRINAFAAELERNRDELRAAASYSRNLLEASLDPLVTIDADGKISDVNAATEAVTGRRRNELLGTDFSDYFTDPAQARAVYRRVFLDGAVKDYPLTIRDAAGHLTEVLYNASVYRNERGEIAGVFAAARDVTQINAVAAELERHRHHLEDMVLQRTRELAQAKDAAESANRAKSLVLANLSHELRTPLNHILGATTLLKREVNSEKGREWLEMMGKSGNGLLRLITNLLETAKLEAEQLQLEEDDFELDWLLRKVEQGSRAAVAEKGLALVSDVAPGVPAHLHGDLGRLARVLGELVDNAAKFSAAGTIMLRVRPAAGDREFRTMRFEIEDQGIGIDDELRAGLFELFSQGDASATRKYGGTGLGLALCKRLVSLMAGEIGFAARPGGGSTFWIEVPLAEAAIAPAAPEAPTADAGAVADVPGKLAALLAALHAGSFEAQAQWAEIAPALAPQLGERLAAVDDAIAGFDFEVAAGILGQLAA